MNKKQLLSLMVNMANDLDKAGMIKEADVVTNVMEKVADLRDEWMETLRGLDVRMRPHSGEELYVVNRPGAYERYKEDVGEYEDFDPEKQVMVERFNKVMNSIERPHPLTKEIVNTWDKIDASEYIESVFKRR